MRSLFSKVFLAHLLTLLIALATVNLLLSTSFDRLYMSMASRDLATRAVSMARQLAPFAGDPSRQRELEDLTKLLAASSIPRPQGVTRQTAVVPACTCSDGTAAAGCWPSFRRSRVISVLLLAASSLVRSSSSFCRDGLPAKGASWLAMAMARVARSREAMLM